MLIHSLNVIIYSLARCVFSQPPYVEFEVQCTCLMVKTSTLKYHLKIRFRSHL